MVDVDAPAGDGLTVPVRLHRLLLALAGRIDDSALTAAHELIARADADEAAELIVGTLVAGRIPVRATERRELAQVLELGRCEVALVDDIVVDELVPLDTHRFTGGDAPEYGIAQALERTVRVLPDVRAVHAVWRNTPAGAVPGPLPQRVVLVEVGPDGTPPAVAYRVGVALRRAGINAVVEVLDPSVERSGYHDSALAAARLAWRSEQPEQATPDFSEYGRRAAPAAPAVSQPRVPEFPAFEAASDPWSLGRHSESDWTPQEAAPDPTADADPPWRTRPEQPTLPEPAQQPESPRRAARPWDDTQSGQAEAALSGNALPEDTPQESIPQVSAPQESAPQESAEPTRQQADAAGFPAPVEFPPSAESTWSEAFREEVASTDQPVDQPVEPDQESRAASTTEMSPAEMAQLREALAEDPDKGREIAASVRPGEVVEIPELDLNDPQLSERDRELLRELHAELAARERAEATRMNGSQNS